MTKLANNNKSALNLRRGAFQKHRKANVCACHTRIHANRSNTKIWILHPIKTNFYSAIKIPQFFTQYPARNTAYQNDSRPAHLLSNINNRLRLFIATAHCRSIVQKPNPSVNRNEYKDWRRERGLVDIYRRSPCKYQLTTPVPCWITPEWNGDLCVTCCRRLSWSCRPQKRAYANLNTAKCSNLIVTFEKANNSSIIPLNVHFDWQNASVGGIASRPLTSRLAPQSWRLKRR